MLADKLPHVVIRVSPLYGGDGNPTNASQRQNHAGYWSSRPSPLVGRFSLLELNEELKWTATVLKTYFSQSSWL